MYNNNFIFHANNDFTFLNQQYGFCLMPEHDNIILWKHIPYVFQLSYAPYTREVDLLFYVEGDPANCYSIGELLKYAGYDMSLSAFQASSEDRLENALKKLASLLKNVCERCDLFTPNALAELRRMRTKDCEESALRDKLLRVREQANNAWQKKDFKALVLLYEPYLQYLLPSEIKKYEYAKKHG